MKFRIWFQCFPNGEPCYLTASSDKFLSRALLQRNLYPGEEISWTEIRSDGWIEKEFIIIERSNPRLHLTAFGAGMRRLWAKFGSVIQSFLARIGGK